MLDFSSALYNLLQRDHGPEWQQLCRDLLQPSDPPDLSDSQQQTDSAPPAYYNLGGLLAKTREQQKGAFTRPYYQLVAFTLDECRTRNWQFPPDVINSSTHISAITNTERIQEIQQEMSQILARCDNEDEDEQKLERFLFEVTHTMHERKKKKQITSLLYRTLVSRTSRLEIILAAENDGWRKHAERDASEPERVRQSILHNPSQTVVVVCCCSEAQSIDRRRKGIEQALASRQKDAVLG